MEIESTDFNGLLILKPRIFGDQRGYFMESFNRNTFNDAGINVDFVQDNQSSSTKGVMRGLHFQKDPYAQVKLIRVLNGLIRDVVVDLRVNEPTYKKHYSIDLSSDNKKQLLVPKGFAHGFIVLSDTAEVLYKCDDYYHPESEGGIAYNDPSLGIDWGLPQSMIRLSAKDAVLPPLRDANVQF